MCARCSPCVVAIFRPFWCVLNSLASRWAILPLFANEFICFHRFMTRGMRWMQFLLLMPVFAIFCWKNRKFLKLPVSASTSGLLQSHLGQVWPTQLRQWKMRKWPNRRWFSSPVLLQPWWKAEGLCRFRNWDSTRIMGFSIGHWPTFRRSIPLQIHRACHKRWRHWFSENS